MVSQHHAAPPAPSSHVSLAPSLLSALVQRGESKSSAWPEPRHQVRLDPSQLAPLLPRRLPGRVVRGEWQEGVCPRALGVPPLPLPNSLRGNEV